MKDENSKILPTYILYYITRVFSIILHCVCLVWRFLMTFLQLGVYRIKYEITKCSN